jgi:hypothetical protein
MFEQNPGKVGAKTVMKPDSCRETAERATNFPRKNRPAATQNRKRGNICTAYDNGGQRSQKLGLSRTAQRSGFAVWVFAHGAFDRRPSLP